MLKSKSALDSFWAALVWVYDTDQPRIVVDDDLKTRWKSFSTGFKNTRASDVFTEGLSAYEGKESPAFDFGSRNEHKVADALGSCHGCRVTEPRRANQFH